MRFSPVVALGFLLSAGVWAQDVFEPVDFNVTQALLDNGVNVSAIPSLAGLAERSLSSGCSIACTSLKLIFGDAKVESRGETAYDDVINYFWSTQQREPSPYCIFKPEKAIDVSTLVLLSRLTQCPFAVRSGGHAAFAGASSANDGITVTFEKMKKITLSSDKKIAAIEPGNLWFDIYTRLAQDNLAVVGGRVSGIGIGGLTTGGGISYFANRFGWACDNVASYDVVTASGIIVNASPTSFSDLYWALRGGGNNFGIVVNFNLNTFPHGPQMFGGQRRFFNTSFPAVIDAFVNLGVNAATDPKAANFVAITMGAASGTTVAISEMEYSDPILDAPIFQEYRNIPAFSDTTKLDTLAYFTQQLNASNPKGYRETFWTASSKLDKQMVQFVFDVSFDEFSRIRDVQGIIPANTLQIVSVPALQQMQKNGGNALGIKPADGPIFLINISMRWDKTADDARVLKASANVVRRMLDEAKRRSMEQEFLYMNYASQFQDVIGSYGEATQRLRQVAQKYDPTAVYQDLQPGYFKLDGPPVNGWPQ